MGVVCCREELLDLEGEVDLSHFTLLRSVGKGAFGKVRVVQHKGSKKLYALKYINKTKCINMRAVENIISERRLLEQIDFNLIVNMRYAFQDDENLFMVLDLMLGGDLRFHLDRLGTMPEDYVRFYAAEIALSLNYLHSLNIIHRDLKPDNILLDEQGHAHLTDFNIATVINNAKPLTSVAGSFAYIAPEILLKRGYLASVDWWSMGIVLYELLFGKRPFRGKTNDALQQAILNDNLHFPENHKISPYAIDFLKSLLTRDVKTRIGVGKQGFQKLMNHPWFNNIPWDRLEKKQADPPFIPDSKRANFDPTHELEEILLEDNPLKVKKRNPKKSGAATSYANSLKSSMTDPSVVEQSPERQMMDEKFLTFDYTKPYENENRKKMVEQKYWAQRMNKTTSEKQDHNRRKAAATYKTSVLDYLNQKPATPLSAGDILKLEELARSARSGAVKDKGTEWRPPSGLIGNAIAGTSQLNDIQARDEFILQNGGIPPPSRPPPIISHYNQQHNKDNMLTHNTYDTTTSNNTTANTTNNTNHLRMSARNNQPDNNYTEEYIQQQQSYESRRSSDSSYRLASSPDNSEYPLISSTAAISIENLQQLQPQQQQKNYQSNLTSDPSYLYAVSTISTASSQTLHDSNKSIHGARSTPVRVSSIPRFHGNPLPPPTSLPPPIPTSLPPLPPVPKDYL